MMNFNMHSVRRAAARESWISHDPGPIRSLPARSSTWGPTPDAKNPSTEAISDFLIERDGARLGPWSSAPQEAASHQIWYRDNPKNNALVRAPDTQISESGARKQATGCETQPSKSFISKFRKKDKPGDSETDMPPKLRLFGWNRLSHQPFTVRNQLERTLFNAWFNLLLLLVPVGFVLNYIHSNPVTVFFVNFLAILPLASLLGFAMDELRLRTGDIMGALVYMSFGNIVQTVTSIFLLKSRQIETLKTSLIGGIFTLILLNTGVAFCWGGYRRNEQFFNKFLATVFNTLLSVSITSLIIPTASAYMSATSTFTITKQSRGMAVVLILAYVLYLFFELGTHKSVFEEESPKVARRMRRHELPEGAIRKGLAKAGGIGAGIGRPQLEEHLPDDELLREHLRLDDYEDECEPQLHIATVFAVLVLGTTILAFNTQFMIDSIQGLTERANVPRDFIGMVLLPILSNDAMAIQCAGKDQMDLVIQSALGKSIQTALVVAPILVLIGWFIGIDDMNLLFDGFQVVALFVSVLLAQHCILDGKSNWMKGATLILTYVMVAIASWFQGPGSIIQT